MAYTDTSDYKINYIHVDSRQRLKESKNIYDDKLITLSPFALSFTNGSSKIDVYIPDHKFKVNDRIVINNVISKNVILQNIISIKKNSHYVRVFHQDHGLSLYGLYNPENLSEFEKVDYVDKLPSRYDENDDIPDVTNEYYILKRNKNLDFSIQLDNIKGNNYDRSMIGNNSVNYLNTKHRVYLLFSKKGNMFESDADNYLILLDNKSNINYCDGVNFIHDKSGYPTSNISNNVISIKYYNLFGIPLNYLNAGTPVGVNFKQESMTIIATSINTITIDVEYNAIVDPTRSFYSYSDLRDANLDVTKLINSNRGGGNQSYVRKVLITMPGNPDPNNYTYKLDRIYTNIVQAKIISSIFPNSQRTINSKPNQHNNKLYWRNLNDGPHIYSLSVTPGNYSNYRLAQEIEKEFSKIKRYPYINDNTHSIYDESGHYKYHIVKVHISDETDQVSLTTFREIVQHNAIYIPDSRIEITMYDLRLNFGRNHENIFPYNIKPFNPTNGEILYIYLTENSHSKINNSFPYVYHNLYRYTHHISSTNNTSNVYSTFNAELDPDRKILINFHRIKGIYPLYQRKQELHSINTKTILENFTYNSVTNEVMKENHQLQENDLIITDQFINSNFTDEIFIYQIIQIIDSSRFIIKRISYGEKIKLIYDNLIMNFNDFSSNNFYDWLDQISNFDPNNEHSLSLYSINPVSTGNKRMIVKHKNHQLDSSSIITISNSSIINRVPSDIINSSHVISKIIDQDHYEIILNNYVPVITNNNILDSNIVSIRYPDKFQILFNYEDTLGEVLNFNNVGDNFAITHYKHTISNTDPYIFNILNARESEYHNIKKLNTTGFNYFYISCPELYIFNNTKPVNNVFAIIKWFDNPGGVVFDSFVPSVKTFQTPLLSLSELHFTMYQPNGKLVEFNGIDHSFTIEIVESCKKLNQINEVIK